MDYTTRPHRPRPSRFLGDDEAAYHLLTYDARHELGRWLGTFPWDHFATFTFAYPPAQETALKALKRFVRRLERQAQGRVTWFYVLEVGRAGLWHLHVLLEGTKQLMERHIEGTWSQGRADVSPFDQRRGATYYVTKCVGSDVVEYDIDHRCRRLTR